MSETSEAMSTGAMMPAAREYDATRPSKSLSQLDWPRATRHPRNELA